MKAESNSVFLSMKKLIYKVLHPKFVSVFLLIIFFSFYYLIKFDKFDTVQAYFLYLIMTYSLIVICIKVGEILSKKINQIIDNNYYLRKYKFSPIIQYKFSLYTSLVLNIVYVLFKFLTGIYFRSLWFISFAIYYFILIVLRVTIVKGEQKPNKTLKDEYISYINVGIILLFINLFLTIIVLIIVNGNTLKAYNEIVAISVSVFTFYIFISSIITLIKFHKYKSPLINASKLVGVVTSLVLLFSLEIIMLSTFGLHDTKWNESMIMLTGIVISFIVSFISMYMIINGKSKLKK